MDLSTSPLQVPWSWLSMRRVVEILPCVEPMVPAPCLEPISPMTLSAAPPTSATGALWGSALSGGWHYSPSSHVSWSPSSETILLQATFFHTTIIENHLFFFQSPSYLSSRSSTDPLAHSALGYLHPLIFPFLLILSKMNICGWQIKMSVYPMPQPEFVFEKRGIFC